MGSTGKNSETEGKSNVRQAVPFFAVSDMQQSLRFYIEGLDFEMKVKWIDEGVLRWCWLEIGDAALMLQEYRTDGHGAFSPEGKLGEGVTICFICNDALTIYKDAISRGISASEPFVGNGMWVTEMTDPDGYNILFESKTDVPEETTLSEWSVR